MMSYGRLEMELTRRPNLEDSPARVSRAARDVGRVAVIGAGVAGLVCARSLREHGVEAVVFDKGRTPGGRITSYRSAELDADVGAPYFTVHDERFARLVRSWRDDGVVAPWHGRICALPRGAAAPTDTPPTERFVGTPSMSALVRHLARDVPVRTSHRVDRVERRGEHFALWGTAGEPGVTLGPRDERSQAPLAAFGEFDVLLVCVPSDQAHPLVAEIAPALAAAAARAPCQPCLVLGFVPAADALQRLAFDGLFVGRDADADRVISWLAREASKPQRRPGHGWVVHASAEWSAHHFRDAPERLQESLLDALCAAVHVPRFAVTATVLRRWAYARAPSGRDTELLFDDALKLGLGGDWSVGGRVEGAFLSGIALADRVLGLEVSPPAAI